MIELSRYDLFSSLVDSDELNDLKGQERIKYLLGINAELLKGFERADTSKEQYNFGILKSNAKDCMEMCQEYFGDEVDKEVLDYLVKLQLSSQKDYAYLLAQAIRKLAKWNNTILDKVLTLENIPQKYLEKPDGWNQVFLSHAFLDKLYAFFLFLEFYDQGIYLYVDWMHNGELKPDEIKNALSTALDDSAQFLFLRTPNSELRVKGSSMIRGWCSWELGYFHEKVRIEGGTKARTFYINQFGKASSIPKGTQYSGLLRFEGNFDDDGFMVGHE